MSRRRILENKITYEFLTEAPDDEEGEATEDEPAEEAAEGETEDSAEGEEEIEEEGEEEVVIDNTSMVDAEIDAVLIDFESQARFEKAELDEPEFQAEGFLYESGISLLTEEDSEVLEIDTEVFAGEVARLIKNYDNLLDMEALLLRKSEKFIADRYGEEAAEKVIDSLEVTHGISLKSDTEKDSELSTPLAVGASSAAAAAS